MDTLVQLNAALAGRYTIEREIGRGGMATVYVAEDLRHGRRVAIKVLHSDLRAVLGAERFLTEIRVTAAMQHPHLLPLFDSGQVSAGHPERSEGPSFLYYVMPFVEGESLRARLAREAQLPVDDAVRIAAAVASAVDYAHRHGVIHRDLKPENILLHDGQPLVADFGIALAVTSAGGDRITRSGVSVGTPQYMAPEQAAGDRAIDGRTDIYALGAVLYEMLTGEPPHSGPTAQAVIARIISEKPTSVRALRETVPDNVAWAVERALAKLPADRFSNAREFAEALTRAGLVPRASIEPPVTTVRVRRWLPLAGVAALLIAAAAAIGMFVNRRDAGDGTRTVRFPLVLPRGVQLDGSAQPFALSPDGKVIALIVRSESRQGQYVVTRSLDDPQLRELTGAEGATQPFFSPDGRWLAFYSGSTLRKVPALGGSPLVIGEVPEMVGASWGRDDEIVVSSRGRLAVIPAAGGVVRPFSSPRGGPEEIAQILPLVLADGKTVVYTSRTRYLEQSTLSLGRVGDSVTTPLGIRGTAPLGVVDGLLVFATARNTTQRNDLVAVRFDGRRRSESNAPTPVINGVSIRATGFVRATLSSSGALMYLTEEQPKSHLVLVEPGGEARTLLPEPRQYLFPRFSPDGKRVAISFASENVPEPNVHVIDLASRTHTQLTQNGGSYQEWSPDGSHIVYSRGGRDGRWVWWRSADQTGQEELVFRVDSVITKQGAIEAGFRGAVEPAIGPDGQSFVFRMNLPDGGRDLWYWRRGDSTPPRRLVDNPGDDFGPRFSPDGRWVAWYGRSEAAPAVSQVYVSPFPGPGPRHQVSIGSGGSPIWAPDGKRLFYVRGGALLAAHLTLTPRFAVTRTDTLFAGGYEFSGVFHAGYDVAPDGKTFVVPRPVPGSGVPALTFVHGWRDELRTRMSGTSRR